MLAALICVSAVLLLLLTNKRNHHLHSAFILLFCSPTVFQCGSVDLSTGWTRPGSVEGLDYDPVLGKLL